jgi:hypothetical protein
VGVGFQGKGAPGLERKGNAEEDEEERFEI